MCQEERLNQFLPDRLTYRRLCTKGFVYIGWGKDKGTNERHAYVN